MLASLRTAAVFGVAFLKAYAPRKSLGGAWFFYNCVITGMILVTIARDGSGLTQLATDSRRLASPTFGVDGFRYHFLRDQAKLRRVLRVALVVKSYWLQSQNGFAAIVHRLYLIFETARRTDRT